MSDLIPDSRSRASLLLRAMAAGVDLLCLGIIARLTELLVDGTINRIGYVPPAPLETLVQASAILLISTCEFLGEASPGKLICGLRIRALDGQRAPIHRRIVRWALKTIPLWLALVAALIEQYAASRGVRSDPLARRFYVAATFATVGLFIAFVPVYTRARQTLYDMIAGTAVYPAKSRYAEHHGGFEPVIAAGER